MSEPGNLPAAAPSDAQPQPMTPTLMGRLFIVPAIIVCVLLAVAVVVVMFGTTAGDKPEKTENLLAIIEQDTGDRTMGTMLMPRAKESWQAAQELAHRFQEKDKFLKPDEIEAVAQRIIRLLEKFPPGQDNDEVGPLKQYFLMKSLARLETASGVEPLVKLLNDPNGRTRQIALQSLAEMRRTPEARRALERVILCLKDRQREVQIVACAAVVNLADRGDPTAIKAIAPLLDGDREVQWNAATALARLGDGRGRLVLMNMLDRGYWEGLDLEYVEKGSTVRRKLGGKEVDENLRSAIGAAAVLKDPQLDPLIAKLADDKSLLVRDAARAARGVERSGSAKDATGGGMIATSNAAPSQRELGS